MARTKKDGFFRRRGRFIRDTVNPGITMPDGSERSSWSMIGGLFNGMGTMIASAFRHIRHGMSAPPDPSKLDPGYEQSEYRRIYKASGLTPEKVRSIQTGLRVELGVFTIFAIYAVVQIAYGVVGLGTRGLIAPMLIIMGLIFTVFAATRVTLALWRLDMHAHERYQPIGVWLRRGGRGR